ncbi:hypothetical protein [Sphingomonas sp. LT1P40]|uniref:hypothetical protein n=1 Tax=Alteristakelama amylovorans TaxID=3096166 RepID=UPI002FCA8DDA
MNRPGLLLALALLTPSAAVASPLLDAFKAACYDVRNFDGVGKAAVAAGWTEVAEAQADPRIAKIVMLGRDAVKKEEPDSTMTGQTFRQRFDGRDVYLVTSRFVAKEGYWGNGCRAYDLDAPAAPARETLDSWVGKPPTGTSAAGNATKRLWEPWKDGVTLEITYVPRDNPLGTAYGIQGLVLVSQSIGGF